MDIEKVHVMGVLLLYTDKKENKNVWSIKVVNVKIVAIINA